MSLLTNVMDHSLDDGYAEAAARKKADGRRRACRRRCGRSWGWRPAWCSRRSW